MTAQDHAKALRDFIRANSKAEGALDALDALHALEGVATTEAEKIRREGAFAEALFKAQQAARAAVKDTQVSLLKQGRNLGAYSVAETEQLIQIAREAMAEFGLSIATGGEQVVIEGGGVFLRIRYGIRHVFGHVEWTTHDWPAQLSGGQQQAQNARRGTSTSALGYFIRDMLLLERKDDEGEAGQARGGRRSSGPQRRGPPPRQSSAPSESPSSGPPQIGGKAAALIDRIEACADLDALDKAEGFVADLVAASVSGSGEYADQELAAMERAVERRRESLEGGEVVDE